MYTWQNGRQLESVSMNGNTVSFVYNENGLRVQKKLNPDTSAEVVTNYTLHGKNIVHMTQGSNELHFFYDAQNKPVVVVYNGTPYSYVKDLQGDIVAILDNNGTAVVQYKYDAWGKPISKTGSMASTLGTVQPFRYRGYVYDEESSLYYLNSRFFSPTHLRFISADFFLGARTWLLLHNLYSYCANNPLMRKDKDGTEYISSLKEMYDLLYESRRAETFEMYVSEFIAKAETRIGTRYDLCKCSTVIEYAAGWKGPSRGMSQLFREQSLMCGSLDTIGYDCLPRGTILGQMKTYCGKPYTGGEYDPTLIVTGDVDHGGIFLGLAPYQGNMCVWVLQSTAVATLGVNSTKRFKGVQITAVTVEEMQKRGWNVWMWDKRLMDDYYKYSIVIEDEDYYE